MKDNEHYIFLAAFLIYSYIGNNYIEKKKAKYLNAPNEIISKKQKLALSYGFQIITSTIIGFAARLNVSSLIEQPINKEIFGSLTFCAVASLFLYLTGVGIDKLLRKKI
jgi:hypothetical protein